MRPYLQGLPPPAAHSLRHGSRGARSAIKQNLKWPRCCELRHIDSPAAMTGPLRNAYIEHDRNIKETIDEYMAFRDDLGRAMAEREAIIASQ